jgi:type IV pilus assembly protein PilO
MMDLSEVNWDFNAAGSWPLQLKIAVIVIICALVAGGGVYAFTMDQLNELQTIKDEEEKLIATFEEKQRKAVSLADYRAQFDHIKGMLKDMMRQMPKKSEVADLLKEISQTALKSGLEPRLFQPEPEEPKEGLYIGLPYIIEMSGKYDELGLFVSGLATLSRIVTVHNIDISPLTTNPADKDGKLLMKAVVRTYIEGGGDAEDEEGAKK